MRPNFIPDPNLEDPDFERRLEERIRFIRDQVGPFPDGGSSDPPIPPRLPTSGNGCLAGIGGSLLLLAVIILCVFGSVFSQLAGTASQNNQNDYTASNGNTYVYNPAYNAPTATPTPPPSIPESVPSGELCEYEHFDSNCSASGITILAFQTYDVRYLPSGTSGAPFEDTCIVISFPPIPILGSPAQIDAQVQQYLYDAPFDQWTDYSLFNGKIISGLAKDAATAFCQNYVPYSDSMS